MTTDADEGRRHAEAMKPEPFKVGDTVRLKSGVGPMTVVTVDSHGDQIEVAWQQRTYSDGPMTTERDTFPARALVRV